MKSSLLKLSLKAVFKVILLPLLLLTGFIVYFFQFSLPKEVDQFYNLEYQKTVEAEEEFVREMEGSKTTLLNLVYPLIESLSAGAEADYRPDSAYPDLVEDELDPKDARKYANSVAESYRKRYLFKLNRLYKSIYTALPSLQSKDGKSPLAIQYYVIDLCHQNYRVHRRLNSRMVETMQIELDENASNVQGASLFMVKTFINLLTRRAYVPKIVTTFMEPANMLLGLELQKNSLAFQKLPIFSVNVETLIYGIKTTPARQEKFMLSPWEESMGPKYQGFFVVIVDLDQLFRQYFGKIKNNYTYVLQKLPSRDLTQLQLPFLASGSKPYQVFNKISNVPEISVDYAELSSKVASEGFVKCRYPDKKGQYHYAMAFRDSVLKTHLHSFSVPESQLMQAGLTKASQWAQATLALVAGFFLLTVILLYFLTLPLRRLAKSIQTTSESLNQQDIDSADNLMVDPWLSGRFSPYIEISILKRGFLGQIQALIRQFSILRDLLSLQESIQDRLEPADFEDRIRELYLKWFSLHYQGYDPLSRVLKFAEGEQTWHETGALGRRTGVFLKAAAEDRFQSAFDDLIVFYFEKRGLEGKVMDSIAQQREFEVAEQVQRDLLPKNKEVSKEWKVSSFYQPARYLGGDFYELSLISDGEIFLIADVSGKGLASALYGASVKSLFRALAAENIPWNEVFARVNNALMRNPRDGYFCTLFGFLHKAGSAQIAYASAGHNKMIQMRQGQIKYLSSKGLPFGVMSDMPYQMNQCDLQSGDLLFLYTDGITEAENLRQELYGMDRLEAFLKENHHLNVEQLKEAMKQDVEAFCAGAEPSDDITFMFLRFAP